MSYIDNIVSYFHLEDEGTSYADDPRPNAQSEWEESDAEDDSGKSSKFFVSRS
jgi:hypothetical protein